MEEEAPGLDLKPVDPKVYLLATYLPRPSQSLARAMASFEARVRPMGEEEWKRWITTQWVPICTEFNAFQSANLRAHADQSGGENRTIRRDYNQNLAELLAGESLFTFNDFKRGQDIVIEANPENGKVASEATSANGTPENVSATTNRVFTPAYVSNAPNVSIALRAFNAMDISFVQAPVPLDMTQEQMPAYVRESSVLSNPAGVRGSLFGVYRYLIDNPSVRILVTGRSDMDFSGSGITGAGRQMGLARAETIRASLISLGVSPAQIAVNGVQIDASDPRGLGVGIALE
jgi:outer membrane protein OmpA-like peptidoglycan-associated protein